MMSDEKVALVTQRAAAGGLLGGAVREKVAAPRVDLTRVVFARRQLHAPLIEGLLHLPPALPKHEHAS